MIEKGSMKKSSFIYLFILAFLSFSHAQDSTIIKEGFVSFLNSQHVYCRFDNTNGIKSGDTLFYKPQQSFKPTLIVLNTSSNSCVCKSIDTLTALQAGDKVYAYRLVKLLGTTDSLIHSKKIQSNSMVSPDTSKMPISTQKQQTELLSGKINFSAYNDLSQAFDSRSTGIRVTTSLNWMNIKETKLSLEYYLSYRHRYGLDQLNNDFFDDLKIYSLSLNYKLNSNHQLWIGRRINPNIAAMGVIDGLQYDWKIKNFSAGILAGSRPHFQDYGYNIRLPQAGVVLAYQNTKKTHQFSAAFIEQRYHQLTDRRFSYFQYNGILANKLFCFGSVELDHYSKTDSSTSNQIRLTSIYSQVRYRFSRKISASISYDNRKNVIYYETYFHIIDQLLAQETRQGFRAQVSWQIFKNVSLNLSQFLRFQGHSKPNKTFLAYLYLPNLLKSKINCSLQFQNLETDYIKGLTYGGRISRDLFKSKANIELSYRINQYNYLNQENKINQHILGTTLYLYLSRRLYFSINFEWDKTPTVQSQRMFTSINYRFDNKKNKVKK